MPRIPLLPLAQLAGAGLVLAGVLLVSRRSSAPVRLEAGGAAASAEGTSAIARPAASP
jgi:hypothetical protein